MKIFICANDKTLSNIDDYANLTQTVLNKYPNSDIISSFEIYGAGAFKHAPPLAETIYENDIIANNTDAAYLGYDIICAAAADMIYFAKGWEVNFDCCIIQMIATRYGIKCEFEESDI